MAELLVRVVDKINEDFYLNCQCTKRGDVIVAMPDGWLWGKEELKNPQYRIIVMPDLSIAEAEALTAPEVDTNPLQPSKTLKRRAFKLDLDNPLFSKEFADFLADDTRARPSIKLVSKSADAGIFTVPVITEVVKGADDMAILDNGTVQPIVEHKEQAAIIMTVQELLSVKIEKPQTVDPAIVAADELVIG